MQSVHKHKLVMIRYRSNVSTAMPSHLLQSYFFIEEAKGVQFFSSHHKEIDKHNRLTHKV